MAEDSVARGKRAEMILKDPLWAESWDALKQQLNAATLAAKTDEGRLRGVWMQKLMLDLRQHWERAVKDGQITEHNLKLDAEDKKRRWPFAA